MGKIYRDLRAASVRAELEDSLRRLKLDVIDLYQIHWPDPEHQIEEGWEALAQLKEEGKVRFLGVSNFNVEQMKLVQKIASITSLQPPFSLIRPEVEKEILPFCKRRPSFRSPNCHATWSWLRCCGRSARHTMLNQA